MREKRGTHYEDIINHDELNQAMSQGNKKIFSYFLLVLKFIFIFFKIKPLKTFLRDALLLSRLTNTILIQIPMIRLINVGYLLIQIEFYTEVVKRETFRVLITMLLKK